MFYTPFYCEENIYRLTGERGCDNDRVVLISNPGRRVALAAQRAGTGPASVVVWDYHVILLAGAGTAAATVHDPDSRLGGESPAPEYIDATFPADIYRAHPEFRPRLSIVSGPDFLRRFSSDRTHMRGGSGEYLQPPPPWPPIFRAELGNTLFALIDGTDPGVKRVLDPEELRTMTG